MDGVLKNGFMLIRVWGLEWKFKKGGISSKGRTRQRIGLLKSGQDGALCCP